MKPLCASVFAIILASCGLRMMPPSAVPPPEHAQPWGAFDPDDPGVQRT